MMFNIRIMGDYTSDEQLIVRKEIPENAVEFGIVSDLKKEFVRGSVILLPVFILMVVLTLLKVKEYDYHLKMDLHLILSFVLAVLAIHFLTYVHEFIHALFYPREALKTIWKAKEEGAYFVYCEEMIGRNRFIVMSLAPMFILGIIPFVLWLILPAMIPMPYDMALAFVTWMMTIMAMGDVANVYHVLKEVPDGAKVFSYGLLRSFYIQ